MADTKWSSFTTKSTVESGDYLVGLSATNTNVRYPQSVFAAASSLNNVAYKNVSNTFTSSNFFDDVKVEVIDHSDMVVPATLTPGAIINKSFNLTPASASQNLTLPDAALVYSFLSDLKGAPLAPFTSFRCRFTNISGFDAYLIPGAGMSIDGLVSDAVYTGSCVDINFTFTDVSDPLNPILYLTGGQLAPNYPTVLPTVVTSTTQQIVMGKTYIANSASLITFTLPATALIGETFKIIGEGIGKYKIAQPAGKQIIYLDTPTTIGTAGSITAPNRYAVIEIMCIAIDTFSVIYSSYIDWDVI